MNPFLNFIEDSLQSPQKQKQRFQMSKNSSSGFSSNKKQRRNSIFGEHSNYLSSNKKVGVNCSFIKQSQQPQQHIKVKRVISDDFCGCQNTLTTCKRISQNYFQNVSLSQLKYYYQKVPKIQYPILNNSKKILINLLPAQYPEIYCTHLNNLLNNFQMREMTNQSFICLAWIQFHCKLEYVTYFFFNDLKKSLTNRSNFLDSLQLSLIRSNVSLKQEINEYQKLGLKFNQFLAQFYESVGTLIVPLSQYAKFLEIIKGNGIQSLVKLIVLFIVNKRSQFNQILKFWSYNQISDLRIYSRFLNWDVFYQQLQIMR